MFLYELNSTWVKAHPRFFHPRFASFVDKFLRNVLHDFDAILKINRTKKYKFTLQIARNSRIVNSTISVR